MGDREVNDTIRIRTKQLHLNTGEIIPAVVVCAVEQPLEILGYEAAADIVLPDHIHIALARANPHVHARQCVVPDREEFERMKIHETDFDDVVQKAIQANRHYDVHRASLAALKSGIWLMACMGNTPWGPIGLARYIQTLRLYMKHSLIFVHVWPRMEPDVPMIGGQEGKDFGSTFGGSGLSADDRDAMFALWRGGDVSYHNDKARADISVADFFASCDEPLARRFHLYYDGETVLASQRETIALARQHGLRSLRARHVPTGPAFDMIIGERANGELLLPIEVGLDYMYWNRGRLGKAAMINYRRPAHPSREDQLSLITLVRENAFDPSVCFGDDHAPHPHSGKEFKNGLPGSPGTRVMEHDHQILMNLVHEHGFTHHQIDHLAAIHPARYIEQYYGTPFPYPIATMETGAMCNLVVFDPDQRYRVNEEKLLVQLEDPEYHSAYVGEPLRGKVLYTVVNGRVWYVAENIRPMN